MVVQGMLSQMLSLERLKSASTCTGSMLFIWHFLSLPGLLNFWCSHKSFAHLSLMIFIKRICIIIGYIMSTTGRHAATLKYLTYAMEVLNWGKHELKNEE